LLAGKARAHEVAFVVIEFATEEGAAVGPSGLTAQGVGFEKILDPVEGCAIDDAFVLALEPLATVMNLTEIDAVLEKIGERTIGESNAAVVFGNLGVAPFGDHAPAIEFGY
jgi:hypothetical protein